MAEHVARLDQAGALQNSQSPVVAVVGGDGTHCGTATGLGAGQYCSHAKRN